MSVPLDRRRWAAAGPGRPLEAPPVRMVHLGLGSFFKAHQAWWTGAVAPGDPWGIAAFTGRRPDSARSLAAQGGLFTLVERGPVEDRFAVVTSVSTAHDGADLDALRTALAAPATALVTMTVTEAGYHRSPRGGADHDDPALTADIAALRSPAGGAAVTTAPGRLVAGLEARWRAGGEPVAVVPCDNLPANGAAVRRVVTEVAEAVSAELAGWVDGSVTFVSTVVDRITPAPTGADRAEVARATGWDDAAAAVTEPFREWILCGSFPAGRPPWEDAGARFVADATPWERRKLLLLNGAHSMLAYLGGRRGHDTVADAIADETCRRWVERWWDEAAPLVALPAADLAAYRQSLLQRWSNRRVAHRLVQIAMDGTEKLPVRLAPVLLAARAAGDVPPAAVMLAGAWVAWARHAGTDLRDPRAEWLAAAVAGTDRDAARAALGVLAPELAEDRELVDAVAGAVAACDHPAGPASVA